LAEKRLSQTAPSIFFDPKNCLYGKMDNVKKFYEKPLWNIGEDKGNSPPRGEGR